ncbi:MAG TPA: LamG-like jellyroll fold domain-containing protein [Verrucomicrobiae bacterium]|nr:LamG-like jellyroll fold domain-containing protein [Verrucomicrobiae bacterium]
MTFTLRSIGIFCLTFVVLSPVARAQTLVITNGVQTYLTLASTTVIMSNRCELRVTDPTAPLSACVINLNSADAFCVLQNTRPSVVVSSYLSQFRINGAVAIADNNCRVVQYGALGSVVIPHAPSFQPLQVFSQPHFTGTSNTLSQYVYYRGAGLGALNATISSFKLKRGYTATFAQNENGSGLSKNYVAQDGDMEISVLPANFDNTVRFVYVVPWRWVAKKGSCDASPTDLQASWWYNWNLNQNSTRDLQYVAIRQQPYWPGLDQNWQTRGINHLLGYNEPNNPVEDAYENLTPPGSVSDAVARWPELLATGLRVGAPAVTDGGYSWIVDFINEADAAGRRVDYVPIHYYRSYSNNDNPAGAANQLYNFLKSIYDATKRPIWVTEFNNGANWTSDADPTYAQNAAVIQAMINMMDDTPWIERYSIYSRVEYMRQTHYDEGGLTPMGVMYRDHVAPMAYLQGLQSNGTRSFSQLRFEGDVFDSSGHGNNGIATGSPAFTNGYNGQALVFDGANTYVTLPPNIANNNAFTFAAWIQWNGGANWQRIFDFGNSTTHYMFLSPNAAGTNLRFAMRNGGGEQIVQTSLLPQGSWQHVAVTLSGSTARIYRNGLLVAQNTGMSITPASFNPRVNFLGESHFVADPLFNGLMDEVLITDYAMSAAQIAGLQTNTPPQFTNSVFARGSAVEGITYSNSITGTASDGDAGDTLTYSKAAGPAWLSIAADGTMTGSPTFADGGINSFTVRATDAAGQSAFALVTIAVTATTSPGTWISDANGTWGTSSRWGGNIIATGVGQTANFSTINITGNRTVTLDSSRTIGTLRFNDVTSPFFNWTLAASGESVLTLDTGSATSPSLAVTNTATISAPLAGTNGFTKSGPGTLILSGDNALSGIVNLDTSSTTLSDGIVRVTGSGALANASRIFIRNNNSGSSTFQLDGSAGSISINAPVTVTCRNNGVTTIHHLAGTSLFNGDILLEVGGNSHTVQSDSGLIVFTGTNRFIGGLMGARTYYFTGAGDHLLIGPILNSTNGAPIAMSKLGTGRMTLEATNTYANGTILGGGTLIVNGTLPAGTLTISNGTTLGGRGTIYSAVTLPAGSTLSPGASVGKLTVNNSVTLNAGSTTLIELNRAAGTNDQLRVTGNLTYGGTLIVTNLDGQLWAGDSFQIFNPNSWSGAFAATNLPALPNGFNWVWSPATGTLSITTTIALNPTDITANLDGGALELHWPNDHTGWRLETNAVSVADADAWFTLPGSTTTNHVFLNVDPAEGNVFFRLVFP